MLNKNKGKGKPLWFSKSISYGMRRAMLAMLDFIHQVTLLEIHADQCVYS